MQDKLAIDFSRPVPLFPLPNLVLLPHATVPLHLFEPRYRTMTRDALDARGLIAIASFDGEQWRQDYEGKPPVRPFVCVGYIVRHDQLEDGRYNLLLQGVCRAKILEELPHDPYRLALVEPTEGGPPMEIDLSDQRQRLEELLQDPLLKELATVSAIHNWLSMEIPTYVMVDLAIMTICDDVEQRYQMLVETDPRSRGRWLERKLRQTHRTLTTAKRFGTGQSTDGYSMN